MIYDEKRHAMEINDEIRCRVAENLRRQLIVMRENDSYEKDVDVAECGNTAYRNIAWAVEPYGNAKKGNYVHIIELLADLIDRPTCRKLIPDEMEGLVFCSNCGAEIGEYSVPNYCPNCGRQVVE